MKAAYNLVCVYIEHPEVADQLEELVLYNDSWTNSYGIFGNDETSGNAKPAFSEKTHDALVKHISSLGLSDESTDSMTGVLDWVKECLNSPDSKDDITRDANVLAQTLTVAILSLCKHIKTMQIGSVSLYFDELPPLDEYIVKSNYGAIPHPGLQKLESIHFFPGGFLDGRDYDGVFPLDIMDCFHKLPALKTFSMSAVDESDNNERLLFPPGTGTFSKLHFTHVGLTNTGICTMIRAAKSLEEFKIKFGGLWTIDGSSTLLHPSLVGACLAEHKTTLHTLDFDVKNGDLSYDNPSESEDEDDEDDEDDDDEGIVKEKELYDVDANEYTHPIGGKQKFRGPLRPKEVTDTRKLQTKGIGSLNEFDALTHLSINPNAILGIDRNHNSEEEATARLVDMLPSNLQFLCFYEYEEGKNEQLDDQMKEFKDMAASRFPTLVDIKGVDELVPAGDVGPKAARNKNGENESDEEDEEDEDEHGEEGLWDRPDPSKDIGWIKA